MSALRVIRPLSAFKSSDVRIGNLRRVAKRLLVGVVAGSCLIGSFIMVSAVRDVPMAGAAGGPSVLWGARVEKRGGQSDLGALDAFETAVGRQLGVVRVFLAWESAWPDSSANRLAANDQIPLVSVKPKRNNNQVVTWAQIATAAPGSTVYNEVVGWATKVKNFGGPVYFTFHHEAEATVNLPYGTASEFIAAWRKVVDVFEAQGVTNAKYLWIATDFSFAAPATERRAAAKWYPGDDWVDAIGADAYNWVNCRNRNEGWRSLQQIIEPLRQFGLAHPSKELWLPEFATVEDPAQPLRKAQWLNDAAALFQQPGWAQFAGVSYFHYVVSSFPNCVWYIDTTPASVQAFAAMGADEFYGGTPIATQAVLFVVGNPVAPTAGEVQAAGQVAGLGATITYVDDDVVTAAEAATYDTVMVSSTVSSGLSGRLRDVDTPLMVWKPWIYDDLRLTGPTATVDYNAVTSPNLSIVDSTHPTAADLSGTIPFSSSAIAIGQPTPTATVVASAAGSPGLFVYNEGDAMFGGTVAVNCRIAFPQGTAALGSTSAQGWQLFTATVDYALGGCVDV